MQLPIDGTAVRVLDSGNGFGTWSITTAEFARLLNDEPPAASAPAGFEYLPFGFVVAVRDGVAVSADQAFES